MSVEELIKKQPSEVRNSNELMMAYIEFFKEIFGYKPDCAGCTFSNDWNVFVNRVKNKNIILNKKIMSNKSFEIRDRSKIYSYRKEGQSVARCYGSDMTEEFAKEYLTTGTDEEVEARKAEFKILPNTEIEVDEELVSETDLTTGTDEEVEARKAEEVKKANPRKR